MQLDPSRHYPPATLTDVEILMQTTAERQDSVPSFYVLHLIDALADARLMNTPPIQKASQP